MRVENDVRRVTVRSCNAAEALHGADRTGDVDSIAPQQVSHSPSRITTTPSRRSLSQFFPRPTRRRGAFRRRLVHDDQVRDLEVRCRNPVRALAPMSHWPSAALKRTGHRIFGDPLVAGKERPHFKVGVYRTRGDESDVGVCQELWVGRHSMQILGGAQERGRASQARCRTTGGRPRHPETNAAHERFRPRRRPREVRCDCAEVPRNSKRRPVCAVFAPDQLRTPARCGHWPARHRPPAMHGMFPRSGGRRRKFASGAEDSHGVVG